MAKDVFSEEEKNQIVKAVIDAEKNTSGEIQVHIEQHCKEDVLVRATTVFGILKLHKTKLRNGVLFYLAIADHKFAILGDAGINSAVPDTFWNNIKDHLSAKFKSGEICEGLCEGIRMAGNQLKDHFPIQREDVNELPDDISFGQDLK
ncbi:MAG: TPM domain-containing protein [Bacteroidota bacterium]|nr:TPM domain-containing protein [Bacteroidota bacterium]